MKNLILPALAGFVALGWAATPAAAYGGGDYCREYTRQVMIGGRMETSYGMACLQPDGQWLIDGDRRRPLPTAVVYEPNDRIIVTERRPVYIIDRDDRHRKHSKHQSHHGRGHDRDDDHDRDRGRDYGRYSPVYQPVYQYERPVYYNHTRYYR